MRLEITPAALEDPQSIRAYTLITWGAEQEQAYLEGLWKRFGEIGTNPFLFRFRNDLFQHCQLASEGKHVILFRVEGWSAPVFRTRCYERLGCVVGV